MICGGPGISDAHHHKECAMQETVHLGSSRTDLFYGYKRYASTRGNWWAASSSPNYYQQKGVESRTSPEWPGRTLAPSHPSLSSYPDKVVGMEKDSSQTTLQTVSEKEMIVSFMVFLEFKSKTVFHTDKFSLHQELLGQEEEHFSLLFEELTMTCSYSSSDGGCP